MTKISPTPATTMKRVALACLVGSAIEFYDFLIYGTAAALVFPTVFFPHLDPTVAAVASMGTFAVAFLSRPFGAAVFGYFGDRLGRKKTLVATLLIMGLATVTVGLVPTTVAIGAAAPLILTTMRLLQGFAVGGEWAGSALLSAEYAPASKRGWYGMFTVVGGGIALVLTSLTFLGVNYTIGESSPTFMQWGWRIPFLVSAALIAVALYVRFNIDETPVFARERADEKTRLGPAETPIAQVLRRQRREIVLEPAAPFAASASSTWPALTWPATLKPDWGIRAAASCSTVCWVDCCASCSPRFLPLFATNSGAAASYWPGGRWLYPGRCWSCR